MGLTEPLLLPRHIHTETAHYVVRPTVKTPLSKYLAISRRANPEDLRAIADDIERRLRGAKP